MYHVRDMEKNEDVGSFPTYEEAFAWAWNNLPDLRWYIHP